MNPRQRFSLRSGSTNNEWPLRKVNHLNINSQLLKDNGTEALTVEDLPLSSLVATLPDFSDADFDVSELKAH